MPPVIQEFRSEGAAAQATKETFARFVLSDSAIDSLTYDQASTAEIVAIAAVNGEATPMRFRLVFWTHDGQVGIPREESGSWKLAVWAPSTYFQQPG